ncbi:hypothetical protein BTA35_0216345 [Oceanospirillum linum]|uniref:Uncharacterized protein n=1 Tax=Oceanospirillum linum TaxID=966 RepID=A0A1T1H831_OCELI|nr:hypothetical protein BTA35_0216345 [Oceanospirillum linum]
MGYSKHQKKQISAADALDHFFKGNTIHRSVKNLIKTRVYIKKQGDTTITLPVACNWQSK